MSVGTSALAGRIGPLGRAHAERRLAQRLSPAWVDTRLAKPFVAAFFLAAFCSARADEYDVLRQRWKGITVGVGYDTTDADVKSRLSSIASSANTSWSSMDKSAARSNLWSDAASQTVSAHLTTGYGRLRNMALAYATSGCSLYTNATLLADTVGGLEWMNSNRYNTVIAQYDNWWDWEIGVPLNLTDIAVLLYDQLTAAQRTNYMAAVNFHTPTPDMTQANEVWKARVVGVRGCVMKDSAKLVLARNAFSDVFPYVTSSDGFYRDGSFVQHTYHPYTAGYGASLLANMAPVLTWLSGSTWAVVDPAQTNLFRWVYDSFEPIIYRGAAWDLVRGREISRSGSSPQSTGHSFLQNILLVSQFAPPADAARMRSMVKYWALSDTVRGFVANTPLPLLAEAKALMADSNTVSRGELIGHYHFGEMDRVIHLRPGYGFGLSLSSSRIANFESINGENMCGWYTGDGMTILYNADLNHFGDSYWSTVDPYRMPGTTVDTMVRTPPTVSTKANGQGSRGAYPWVGGAKLDEVGSAGMQLDAWGATLTAKKSWFMFDSEIVCLGAEITSADNRTIETIIENRKLITAGGTNAFLVNGSAKTATLGWSEAMTNVSWAHLAGPVAGTDIGYYFPQAASVKGLRAARTGSWYDVNTGGSTNPVTRNYLTLWLDHGKSPTNAAYAYVLLPGLGASNVAAYAAAPDIAVIENTGRAQGVRKNAQGYTAVNFWVPGSNSLAGITVDRPCSVITRSDGTWLDIAVADPTQTNAGAIAVEVATAATGAASVDPGIAITQLSPTVKLAVSATGADGRSYRAKLFLGKTGTLALAPVADAYVENGTYAATNFGTAQGLVVKYNGSSSLTREAYLRFDLASQTNGFLLDAALRLVSVTSNGSDQHVIYPVTNNAWTEQSLVWTNKPACGAEIARWSVSSNVPAALQASLGASAKAAAGALLDLRVAAVGGAYVSYASRENGTVTNRPLLLLTLAHPPPQIALTAPMQGAVVHWSQGVNLTASASAVGGSVTNVTFLDSGVAVGRCALPPYRMTVTNLTPGAHSFTAVAIENAGASATSTPAVVTVTGVPLAAAGQALTIKNVPVDVDLRPWASAFATSDDGLLYGVGPAVSGAVGQLADRHTARFAPATNFTGNASFAYTVTDRTADPRLFLYFDMEQASVTPGGLIADVSGHARDGTLEVVGTGVCALTNCSPAATVSAQAALLRERADLNGARIRRQIGTNELSFSDHSWSFSGWFWRAAQTNDDFILYFGNGDGFGANEELHLYGVGGSTTLSLKHFIGQNATDIDLNASGVSLSAWHHVAVTFARTNTASGVMALYLDGALRGTDDSFSLRLDQTVPVVFGGHQSAIYAVTRWFNGVLDELAVFDAALSASEVAELAARSVAHFGGASATNTVTVRVLAPEAAPALNAAAHSAADGWQMRVTGPAEFRYTVEASTNLTVWTPLETFASPALPFLWSDPDALRFSRRFYRVRVEP